MPMPEFKQIVDEARRLIQEIGPSDLARMQQAGEDFTLIDVREPDEHAKGTIAGAVTMPRGILERDIDQLTSDKNRKIVLYCAGGLRSVLAAQSLKSMGFKDVISLSGGYRGWVQSQAGGAISGD